MKLARCFLFPFMLFGNYCFAQIADSVYYGKQWISMDKADSFRISTVPFEVILNGKTTITYIENGRSAAYPNNYPAFNNDFKWQFKHTTTFRKKIPGTVRLKFIVERDSTLTSFETTKSLHPLIGAEVVRAIKNMKKWIQARMGGQLARQRIDLSFWFE